MNPEGQNNIFLFKHFGKPILRNSWRVEWHVKYDGSLAEENSEKEGWLSVLSIK